MNLSEVICASATTKLPKTLHSERHRSSLSPHLNFFSPEGVYTSGIEADWGIYIQTYIYKYMYLCISPPYFSRSSVGFGKWHTSSAAKSTEIAVPRHHRPDTHSSSHLYCNATLQKGSSKHVLTERNKWLICDGWITKTCTKKDAVTWVAFGEKVLPDQKIGQQLP